MSAGASIMHIEAGDYTKVPPGYFWCELFEGEHTSVDYTLQNNRQVPIRSWTGHKSSRIPLRFERWTLSNRLITLPEPFSSMTDVEHINAEFIGGKLIEVHFRPTPDPQYREFIPVWSDSEDVIYSYIQQGYTYIESEDNANGFLSTTRKGFLVHEQDRL
jgi:hypothetical protein